MKPWQTRAVGTFRATALRAVLALTGIYAGWTLTFAGREYRDTPSLKFAAESHIPLQLWGVALFVYAALLITDYGDLGRICGYAVGAGIASYFTVSYGWVLFTEGALKPRNGVILAFLVDVIAFHLASIRVTIERQIGPVE